MMLADMQRDFQSCLLATDNEVAHSFGNAAGMSVYQNNYRMQLLNCLQQAFPQLLAWLGEDTFTFAAIRHIDGHPPHSWTLDAYPAYFGATLATLFPDNPDMHELAWIELALSDAFVAADAAPLSLDACAATDWDVARLSLTPSFQIHAATTNANSIWSALSDGNEAPEGAMLAEPGGLIVWRRDFTACLRQIDALEYEALLHLQTNGEFSALCTWLVDRVGEDAGISKAGALLASWFGSELITAIQVI